MHAAYLLLAATSVAAQLRAKGHDAYIWLEKHGGHEQVPAYVTNVRLRTLEHCSSGLSLEYWRCCTYTTICKIAVHI